MDCKCNNKSDEKAIIYHSLVSKYPGDSTKGCSLIASEIDGNFYFLRGADIVSAEYVKDKEGATKLVLTKVNGDTIETKPIPADSEYKFEYDKVTHTMTVTYPNGEKVALEHVGSNNVATSKGVKGNGMISSPIKLVATERTGTYAPAVRVVELDESGEMPDASKYGAGYRIVTKEGISNFGKLYSFRGVSAIMKALEDTKSEWRVPTKTDWDELLNAAEYDMGPYNEDSHDAHSAAGNGFFGTHAGAALKEAGYQTWGPLADDFYKGEDIFGLSILPVGYAEPRHSFLKDKDNDIEGFHQCTALWSSTDAGIANSKGSSDSAYAKVFDDDHNNVAQYAVEKSARLSLRLVKDYNGENFNEYEEILGRFYPCKHVTVTDCDGEPLYSKIWISVNFDNSDHAFGGVVSHEWETPWWGEYNGDPESVVAEEMDELPEITEDAPAFVKVKDVVYQKRNYEPKTRFFINEWDGKIWEKKMMAEGDSVVIKDYENVHLHEWRVFNGENEHHELIDTVDQIKTEILKETGKQLEETNKKITDLEDKLDAEIKRSTDEDERLAGLIHTEAERAAEAEEKLDDKIEGEIEDREAADEALWDGIAAEEEARKEAIAAIEADIDKVAEDLAQEIEDRKSEDEAILENLELEETARKEADDKLANAIKAEEDARKEADDDILDNIAMTEEQLNKKIDANTEAIKKEAETREANDVAVDTQHYDLINKPEGIAITNNAGDVLFSFGFSGDFGEI